MILWQLFYANMRMCFPREFDVGCTPVIEHHIDTGQHRPVRQALRRHPVAYLDAIDEHVEQLRQQDMIEPSGGPWC